MFQDRRVVGRLSGGALLIPFSNALSTTRIGLDPASLSTGWTVDNLHREVTPAPGGVTVRFDVRRSLQAALTLLDGSGAPWPSGHTDSDPGGNDIGLRRAGRSHAFE